MKKIIVTFGAILISAGPALAAIADVPEMSATGAVVALAAIAAGGAIAWERRRNRPPKD